MRDKDLETKSSVFVSYSREDEDIARALRDRLRDASISCWIDTGVIQAGDEWRRSVRKLIDASPAVVVVCTNRSMASHEVTAEWAYAMGSGIAVIPVVYEPDCKLVGALGLLDRLDFFPVETRPWNKLVSRVQDILEDRPASKQAIIDLGIEKVFYSRHEFLRKHSVRSTVEICRENSELLIVGRSLEAWARESRFLQDAIEKKQLNVRLAVVDPELDSESWMVPGDYAGLDLKAAVEKFSRISLSDVCRGSFKVYFLPNSPLFSFTYFEDLKGPCGVIELGANLDFDERFSLVFRRSRDLASDALLSLYLVYNRMLEARQPSISIQGSS